MSRTKVALLDYENNHRYDNPTVTVVEFNWPITWTKLRKTEWKQPGKLRTGGEILKLLQDLKEEKLDHRLIEEYEPKDYQYLQQFLEKCNADIVYKMAIGNY